MEDVLQGEDVTLLCALGEDITNKLAVLKDEADCTPNDELLMMKD